MGLMAAEEGGLAAVLVLAAAVEDLEAVGAVAAGGSSPVR